MAEAFGVAVHRAARHQIVGARSRGSRDRRGTDSAVDLDVDVGAGCVDHCLDLGDLGLHGRDVGLAAKAGVNGHDQDHVKQIEHVRDCGRGRRRVEGDRRMSAEFADVAEGAVQMVAGFGMHDQHLATGFDIPVRQLIGLLHHEVGLEGAVGAVTYRRNDIGPKGKVGNESAIHHVELEAVDAGFVEGLDFFAEAAEIGRKHRRDDRNGTGCGHGDEASGPTPQCGLIARSTLRPVNGTRDHSATGGDLPVVEIRTDRMATGGEAVGRLDSGEVVFVQGALPDELVRVKITQRKKRFARGEVVEVLSPSSARTEPVCVHARDQSCGGCDWMTIRADQQREFKSALVVEQLQRLGRIETPTVSHREHGRGRRTTVRCLVTNGRAGYRSRRSHAGFAATECGAAHELIEELIVDADYGSAEEVTLRVGALTGERIALLHGTAADAGAVSVPSDVTVANIDACDDVRFHEEVAGYRWQISARSFFQTSQIGAQALVDVVGDLVGADGSIVDLYAGVGLLGGSVGRDRVVASVESSPSSTADARVNLGNSTQIVHAKVESWTAAKADTVIADPARRGLGKGGCATIDATGAARLVLVSCDPASLGRDAALLQEQAWVHGRTEVVDMFPDSSRIEAVTLFTR